ncbi:hypothetical protein HDU67_006129, partial [Dinochytrium kinnereticum]
TRHLSGVLENDYNTSDAEGHDATDHERDSDGAGEISGLRQENANLKAKLSQYDDDFLDEIDDLKANYKECLKRNMYYEEHIRNLCRLAGVASDRILNVEASREGSQAF